MTSKMGLPGKGGHDAGKILLQASMVAIIGEPADDWKTNFIILKGGLKNVVDVV